MPDNNEIEIQEMPIVKEIKLTALGTAYISEEARFVDVRYLVVYTNDGSKHLYAMTPSQAEKLGKQV